MRVIQALLPLLALSPSALAAECYFQSGGPGCVSIPELKLYASEWCRQNFDKFNGNWDNSWKDSHGLHASIGKIGKFYTPQECEVAFNEIVNNCPGRSDGGSWTADRVSLGIYYCQWRP